MITKQIPSLTSSSYVCAKKVGASGSKLQLLAPLNPGRSRRAANQEDLIEVAHVIITTIERTATLEAAPMKKPLVLQMHFGIEGLKLGSLLGPTMQRSASLSDGRRKLSSLGLTTNNLNKFSWKDSVECWMQILIEISVDNPNENPFGKTKPHPMFINGP